MWDDDFMYTEMVDTEKEVVIEKNGKLYIETKYGLIDYIMAKEDTLEAIYYEFEDVIRMCVGDSIEWKIDCEEVESKYSLTTYAKMQLNKFKSNDTYEYYKIHRTKAFDEYIDLLNKSSFEMNTSYNSWFKEKYPDMSDTQIDLEVNMLMLYEN